MVMRQHDPIPLEAPELPMPMASDPRARVPEPPPVRLVTVEDAVLESAAGLECDLDAFYINLFGFERDPDLSTIVYRAENARIVFQTLEPPIVRDDLRPLGIEVPSLIVLQKRLTELEIEFVHQKGLHPGVESILFRDPAGNWLEVSASPRVQ